MRRSIVICVIFRYGKIKPGKQPQALRRWSQIYGVLLGCLTITGRPPSVSYDTERGVGVNGAHPFLPYFARYLRRAHFRISGMSVPGNPGSAVSAVVRPLVRALSTVRISGMTVAGKSRISGLRRSTAATPGSRRWDVTGTRGAS